MNEYKINKLIDIINIAYLSYIPNEMANKIVNLLKKIDQSETTTDQNINKITFYYKNNKLHYTYIRNPKYPLIYFYIMYNNQKYFLSNNLTNINSHSIDNNISVVLCIGKGIVFNTLPLEINLNEIEHYNIYSSLYYGNFNLVVNNITNQNILYKLLIMYDMLSIDISMVKYEHDINKINNMYILNFIQNYIFDDTIINLNNIDYGIKNAYHTFENFCLHVHKNKILESLIDYVIDTDDRIHYCKFIENNILKISFRGSFAADIIYKSFECNTIKVVINNHIHNFHLGFFKNAIRLFFGFFLSNDNEFTTNGLVYNINQIGLNELNRQINSNIFNLTEFIKNDFIKPSRSFILIKNNKLNLELYGYSLGGATANILTILIKETFNINNIICYGIATPQFIKGNYYNENEPTLIDSYYKSYSDIIINILSIDDIITMLPNNNLNPDIKLIDKILNIFIKYYHVGTIYLLDYNNKLINCSLCKFNKIQNRLLSKCSSYLQILEHFGGIHFIKNHSQSSYFKKILHNIYINNPVVDNIPIINNCLNKYNITIKNMVNHDTTQYNIQLDLLKKAYISKKITLPITSLVKGILYTNLIKCSDIITEDMLKLSIILFTQTIIY